MNELVLLVSFAVNCALTPGNGVATAVVLFTS